jgi:hypothetical protein
VVCESKEIVMRIFNAVVFDSYVSGTSATYSDPKFDAMLAAAEKMAIQVVADQVTGGTPTVTVKIEHSADRRSWVAKNGTAEVNGVGLSAGSSQVYGQDSGSVPALGFARLNIALGGSTPAGRLRILCTGRAENQY